MLFEAYLKPHNNNIVTGINGFQPLSGEARRLPRAQSRPSLDGAISSG